MEIGYKPGTRLFSRNFLPFIKGFCMDLRDLAEDNKLNWDAFEASVWSSFPSLSSKQKKQKHETASTEIPSILDGSNFWGVSKKTWISGYPKNHYLPSSQFHFVACLAPWSHRTNGIFQNIFVHGSRGWSFCAPAFCWGLLSESLKGPWRMLGPPKKRETMIDFLLTLVSN